MSAGSKESNLSQCYTFSFHARTPQHDVCDHCTKGTDMKKYQMPFAGMAIPSMTPF